MIGNYAIRQGSWVLGAVACQQSSRQTTPQQVSDASPSTAPSGNSPFITT